VNSPGADLGIDFIYDEVTEKPGHAGDVRPRLLRREAKALYPQQVKAMGWSLKEFLPSASIDERFHPVIS